MSCAVFAGRVRFHRFHHPPHFFQLFSALNISEHFLSASDHFGVKWNHKLTANASKWDFSVCKLFQTLHTPVQTFFHHRFLWYKSWSTGIGFSKIIKICRVGQNFELRLAIYFILPGEKFPRSYDAESEITGYVGMWIDILYGTASVGASHNLF